MHSGRETARQLRASPGYSVLARRGLSGEFKRSRATALQAKDIAHSTPLEGVSPSTADFPFRHYLGVWNSHESGSGWQDVPGPSTSISSPFRVL